MSEIVITDELLSAGVADYCERAADTVSYELNKDHVFSEGFLSQFSEMLLETGPIDLSAPTRSSIVIRRIVALLIALVCIFAMGLAASPDIRAYTARWFKTVTGSSVLYEIFNTGEDELPGFSAGFLPEGCTQKTTKTDWDQTVISVSDPDGREVAVIRQTRADEASIEAVEALKDTCDHTEYLNAGYTANGLVGGYISYGLTDETGSSLKWYDKYRNCIFEVEGGLEYEDILKIASGLEMEYKEYELTWIPGNFANKFVTGDWWHHDVIYYNGEIEKGLSSFIILSYGFEASYATYTTTTDENGHLVVVPGSIDAQESIKINNKDAVYVNGALYWADEEAGYAFSLYGGKDCSKEDLIKAAESIAVVK